MKSTASHKYRGKYSRGMALLTVLIFAVILAMVLAFLPSVFRRSRKQALTERQIFEAGLIAQDLIEVGKYLLLYEKIFFKQNPLKLAGSSASRASCLRDLWGQSLGEFKAPGSNSIVEACGFYDVKGRYIGTQKVKCGAFGNEFVFCSSFVRSPLLSGGLLEDILFEQYQAKGLFDGPPYRGKYLLDLDMTESLDPSKQADLFLPLFRGQSFLSESFSTAFFSKTDLKANLQMEFYTNSSGFRALSSERFVKLTGTIRFQGKAGIVHEVQRSETMMVVLSTPKTFALFVPYPSDSTGRFSTSFSTATNISSSVSIHGPAYFNGTVDKALGSLPTFDGALLLSENIKPSGSVPGPSELASLKQKFPKGFVTNLSAERFLYDGNCASLPIINGTRFSCPPAFGIRNYIEERLANSCWDSRVTVNCNSWEFVVNNPNPAQQESCQSANLSEIEFLTNGYRQVVVNDRCSAVMTPAIFFEALPNTNVFGTVFGGNIRAGNQSNFYALSAMSTGLINGFNMDAAKLGQFNSAAASAYEGVGVPLVNVPFVMSTGGEAR